MGAGRIKGPGRAGHIAIALALLLLMHGRALAEDSTGQVINDLYDAFVRPIRHFGSALVAARVGTGLLGSLVALHVIGAGLAFAAGTIDPFGLAARILRLSVLSTVVLAAIQRQDWFAELSGYDTLGRALEGGFAQIMRWAAVAAGLPDTVDPSSMIRSVSSTVLTALFKMGEVQVFPAGTSMWKAMTNVTGLMVGLLMWFMCVVAYIIAGAKKGAPRSDLKKPWDSITRAAGLKGLRLHDLRHSFASVGAGGGLGLPIVGKLLGHTQTATTARYAHLDADPMRRAADKIGAEISAALEGRPPASVTPLRKRKSRL